MTETGKEQKPREPVITVNLKLWENISKYNTDYKLLENSYSLSIRKLVKILNFTVSAAAYGCFTVKSEK